MARRIKPMPRKRPQPKTFNANALQVRRAYERHYERLIPDGLTYADAGNQLVADLGLDAARALILGQSSDPHAPEWRDEPGNRPEPQA
jgi:hypothetical protein